MNDEKRIRVEPRCVTETARSSVKENPSSFMSMVDELIAGYRTCHDAWAVSQKTKAEGFNLLETMGVDEKELCHSRLLEWLMAWEIEQGTHAQGKLGFQLFLEETGLDSSYANAVYWVQREVAGKKSHIDIEIAANETFIIHIENKINAPEYKKRDAAGVGGSPGTSRWTENRLRGSPCNLPDSRWQLAGSRGAFRFSYVEPHCPPPREVC